MPNSIVLYPAPAVALPQRVAALRIYSRSEVPCRLPLTSSKATFVPTALEDRGLCLESIYLLNERPNISMSAT